MARQGLVVAILWVIEITAALLLMPLVMIFVMGGLVYNLLRWLAIPLLLLTVTVIATLWLTGIVGQT